MKLKNNKIFLANFLEAQKNFQIILILIENYLVIHLEKFNKLYLGIVTTFKIQV